MAAKPKPLTLAQIGDTNKPQPFTMKGSHPIQNLKGFAHPPKKAR